MNSKIIVFDVETPNLRNDRVCAIGISIIDSGVVAESRTILVNPECEFDRKNIEIHGIRPSDVKDAPTFDVVWEGICELFHNNLVVAHNASFDLCVLKKTLAAYEIPESLVYYACTMKIAQAVLKGVENYKLPTLCKHYGINLTHHDAGSDSCACAEILCKFIFDGLNIDDFMGSYDLSGKDGCSHVSHRRVSVRTHALNELSKILRDISSDGVLTGTEIGHLQVWLDDNSELSGNYPYDKIYQAITTVLSDGVVTHDEVNSLLGLFRKVSDPVAEANCCCGKLIIDGKSICLSGVFDRGEKSEISENLTSRGATVVNSVTKKTNILLVGGQGSSSWSSGNYGSKIKKALELQEKGIEITIIREDDFFSMLEE